MSEQLLVGVDIGGTKTAVVLATRPPAVLDRRVFPTQPEQGPEAAVRSIIRSVRELLTAQHAEMKAIRAIGISSGGPLDARRGIIQQPPNLSTWKDVPICSILEDAFHAPGFLENDANAGALAEHAFGAGVGTHNMIFLTMGTGIGAGLILDGRLYCGSSHAAGEIGHVRLTRTGPRGYNKAGAVEGWASGAGIAQLARIETAKALSRGETTRLAAGNSALTARDVAEAASAGDPLARRIVKTAGERLGMAVAILVDILNPECIAVGGLALRLGDAVLEPARAVVRREALAGSAALCRIVPAALGEQIGDVAALCVAMRGGAQ
jgi:glucokinase